jgi:nucleotide-binding universal stress UspA family protein
MQLRRIVVGADCSEEGKAAILAAARLAQQAVAKVTVLTVTPGADADGDKKGALDSLRDLVHSAVEQLPESPRLELALAAGLPGVEIGRFAETHHADLVVVGRKRRTGMQRLLIGDTADSVARRSGVPCLFVLAGAPAFRHVLVALDGTERGMAVVIAAMDFTRDIGARIHGVSVEPAYDNERDAPRLLTSRSARLIEAVDAIRLQTNLGPGMWEAPAPTSSSSPIVFHRGRVVDEIVREVVRSGTDVLVVGYHRGGPAGVIEAGSVARRLAHECPCSVLTIPL